MPTGSTNPGRANPQAACGSESDQSASRRDARSTSASIPWISYKSAVHLKIGELADVYDRSGELGYAVVDPAEPSDDAYSRGGERVQISCLWFSDARNRAAQAAEPAKSDYLGPSLAGLVKVAAIAGEKSTPTQGSSPTTQPSWPGAIE